MTNLLRIIGHTYFAGHPSNPTRETLLEVREDLVVVQNARVEFTTELPIATWDKTRFRTLRDLTVAFEARTTRNTPTPPPAPPQPIHAGLVSRTYFPEQARAKRLTRAELASLGYIETTKKERE